jgi:Cu+-exporting ATPase
MTEKQPTKETSMRIPLFSKSTPKATDPVCGMQVDTANPSGGTLEHKGQTYYFCSPGCKASFTKDPESFLSSQHKPAMGH